MLLRLRHHALLFAVLAGASLFVPRTARAASTTFGFSAADSPQQSFSIAPEVVENPMTLSRHGTPAMGFAGQTSLQDTESGDGFVNFILHGGNANVSLTQGTAKTIHVGSGAFSNGYGDAQFDGEPLPHALSLSGIAGTVTQTLPQTDDLSSVSSTDQHLLVDIHAGPTVTFDMGTQGRIDVTPQEYNYDFDLDTKTPSAPKFAYTLLLRPAAVVPSSVTVSPSPITYADSATGTVTLTKAAPDAETIVLASSNPAAASVPATVQVAAGQQTATFPITTYRVDSDTAVTLSAAAGGTTKTVSVTVKTRPEVSFTYNIAGQPQIEQDGYLNGDYVAFSATGGSGTVKLAQGQPYTITVGSYTVSNEIGTDGNQDDVVLETAISRTAAVNSQTQTLMQHLYEYADLGEDYTAYFSASLGDSPTYNGPTVVYDLGAKGRVALTAIGFDLDGSYYYESDTFPAQYTFLLSPPNTPASLLVSPGKVYGGATTYGKVTLATAAGTGGQTVVLQSSDPAAASVPDTIVVPAGVKSAVFPITTYTTEEDSPVTLYASSGGKSISVNNILTVLARYQFSGTVKSGSSGLSGVIVGASSTGTFILTSTAAPAASIPDNSAAGLATTIVPKGSGTISGLVVGVDITHPNIGDLRLTLKGPDGTTAILYDQSGGSQANLLASYPVLRTPVGSLSGFNGKSVQGTWTLLVQDLAAGNVGTLNSWNLTFTYGGTYTGSGTTASDGTYTVSNLKEGTYTAVPSKSGNTFTPASRSVAVGPNVTDPNPSGVNFTKK